MEGLPFELQDRILHYLKSPKDIKTVRLLNRNFHDVATPRLFRRLFLTIRTESFARLKQICASWLSQYVRCLHYNIWELPLILESQWDQALERLGRKRADNHRVPVVPYQEYHGYYLGQEVHDEYSFFKHIFQCLPAIRRLEISESEPPQLSKSGKLPGLSRIVEAAACCHEHGPLDTGNPTLSGQISRTLAVISAHGAVRSGTLQSLSLDRFRWHWLDVHGVRMWHEPALLEQALRGLRRLKISVPENWSGLDEEDDDYDDADVPDPWAAVGVWKKLIGDTADLVEIRVRTKKSTLFA